MNKFLLFMIFSGLISIAYGQGDNCGSAVDLPVNIGSCVFTEASNSGLTNSGQTPVGASCADFSGGDMWYSVDLPPSGEVTVTTQFAPGTTPAGMDINLAAYSGTCGSLSLIGCDEDGGLGFYAEIVINGTPGETVFVQLWETNNNTQGEFNICANGTTACTAPTATFTESCAGNNQYEVEVDITSLGSASSLDITNDGGAPAISGISSTGIQTVGPFALGTTPTITMVHNDDASCNVSQVVTDVGLTCENVLTCGNTLSQSYCYQNNDNTSFLYSSPDGSPVTIDFLSGSLENGVDEITIRNGNNSSAPILFQGSNGGDLTGISETASSGSIFLTVTSDLSASCEDGSFDFGSGWDWEVTCEGCTVPSATFTVVEDCGAGTFTVDVDITSLGNSASLTILNDAGVAATTGVSSTGVQNVGPFTIGSPVEITVSSESITGCATVQGGLDFECPTGANCTNAATVISQTTFAASEISGDVSSVSYSQEAQCNGPGNNPDPYFTFTAVGSVTYFRVETSGDFDPTVEVLDGCGGESLACVNDAEAGQRELFWVTGLTPGNDYVYRVYHAGSDSPGTTTFTTAVAHIPQVRLRPFDCGSTDLTANSLIRATFPNPNFLLQGYEFEFTELEEPFNTYEVVSPNGSNPNFLLNWFDNLEYGRSYSVRVRARMYQGGNWGEYGPSCTISTVGQPTTFLLDIFENGTYAMCNQIKARKILGTTNYRWVFDDGQNQLIYNSGSSSPIVPLQSVDGLQLGTSYTVTVFATDEAGNESVTSDPKLISMQSSVPDTEINPLLFDCGSTVSLSQVLSAVEVCSAEQYTFRFTNLTQPGSEPIEYVRPTRVVLLSFVPGLVPGDTYNVEVRANSGGLEGSYGNGCQITIAGLQGLVARGSSNTNTQQIADVKMTVFPNPANGESVEVFFEDEIDAERITIEVFDLSGKKVFERQYGKGMINNRMISFDRTLSSGIYLIKASDGQNLFSTEKIIVE